MSGKTALEMSPVELRKYRPFRNAQIARPESRADEALEVARNLAMELRTRFNARRVALFGSLARREFSPCSDIDVAVWGISPGEFYRAVGFAEGFSHKWKVDLVDVEDCAEALRQRIEEEGLEL